MALPLASNNGRTPRNSIGRARQSPALSEKENASPVGELPGQQQDGSSAAKCLAPAPRRKSVGRRKSSGASSLPFGGPRKRLSPAEEAELAENYINILKLSSENKINQKNSWSLNLIDHMESAIEGAGGEEGESGARATVNFQRASCTLDASVKIYSYRVDETYVSSCRVLESLSRTDDRGSGKAPGEGDGDDDAEGDGEASGGNAPRARGRKEASSRRGIADTLETKLASINLSNGECDFDVDPLFAKMSKTFDEAGSKGMLLNNLCVANGCRIVFDGGDVGATADGSGFGATAAAAAAAAALATAAAVAAAAAAAAESQSQSQEDADFDSPSALATAQQQNTQNTLSAAAASAADRAGNACVDVSSLRGWFVKACPDLNSLPLCSQLEEVRADLTALGDDITAGFGGAGAGAGVAAGGAASGDASDGDGSDYGGDDPAASWGGESIDSPGAAMGLRSSAGTAGDFPAAGNGGGGDKDGAAGGTFEPLEPEMFTEPDALGEHWTVASPTTASRSQRAEGGGGGAWAGVGVSRPIMAIVDDGQRDHLNERLCGGMEMIDDEYAFFDRAPLAGNLAANGWAGNAHWKFIRPRVARIRQSQSKAAAASAGVEDDGGDPADKPAPATRKQPRRGKRVVVAPFDDDSVEDPVYSKPAGSAAAKATQLSNAYIKRKMEADGSKYTLPKDCHIKAKDLARLFLRLPAVARRGKGVAFSAFEAPPGGEGGMDFGGGYDGPGFDDELSDGEGGSMTFAAPLGGYDAGAGDDAFDDDDEFSGMGMGMALTALPGVRQVEKIRVKYATRAKRVDVRRLKKDIWQRIASNAANPAAPDEDDVDAALLKAKGEAAEDSTFSSVVGDLSAKEEQAGVTVPFYFICLLHLANEKGLRLEGLEDMSDLAIALDLEADVAADH